MAKKDFSKVESIKENIGAGAPTPSPAPALKGGPAHDAGVEYIENAVVIPIAMIEVDAQVREEFDEDGIKELAASIDRHGLLQPVTVRWDAGRGENGRYVLIAGERRLRALKHLKRTAVEAIRRLEQQTEVEILTAQIVENDQRQDVTPLERAKSYQKYMEQTGQNAHMAAKSLGKASSTFAAALAILDTAPAVQVKVASGELSTSDALELRKLNDPALQEQVAERIVAEDMNREEAAEAVQEAKAQDSAPAPKVKGRRGATRGGKAAKSAGRPAKVTTWAPKLTTGIKVSIEAKKGLSRDAILELIDQMRARVDADFPLEQAG